MRVLISGDREWKDRSVITTILDGLFERSDGDLVVIEGCARGADKIACEWWPDDIFMHEHYPADWETHHRAAGPIRNRQMMTEGKPDVVFAFHDDLENSKGTKDMVSVAKKAGVPTYVIRHA